MQNPFDNMSIVTVPADSDGEDVSFHYVFGHECPHEQLETQIKAAVTRWFDSEDGTEYAVDNWGGPLDWIEVFGNMPQMFFLEMGLARLDEDCGSIRLDPDEELLTPEQEQRLHDLAVYGPEGEASLQGERD